MGASSTSKERARNLVTFREYPIDSSSSNQQSNNKHINDDFGGLLLQPLKGFIIFILKIILIRFCISLFRST